MFVIQIGAMDGKVDDSAPDKLDAVYKGITLEGWRAIIFEPHPAHFKELTATYANYMDRVTLLNMAIGLYCGETDMFESGLKGAHTLVESVLVANRGYGYDWKPIRVKCMDINTCFEIYGTPDKLFIDVEGFDGTIIECIDLLKYPVPYIRFEYVHIFEPQLTDVINKLIRYHYTVTHYQDNDMLAELQAPPLFSEVSSSWKDERS